MAAKVVMVAVPAVLGAASIRVYRVSDRPTEGLVTKERLNVYYPLHSSPQPQDVPHQAGVIESGLSSARHTILPVVQAVKGAYVSGKTGTIKCYHTGQDVYYYLKDPPPEFLPRFGTIAMAGLLGMFLARKGSRLSRVALPMGLMTAGASVCYPAQTAAVVKVAGKKAYAAGLWTSASVSSLLSSPPKPPAAAEEAALSPAEKVLPPEPVAAAVVESVPSTDASSGSPVQSSPVPETEEKPPTETTAEQTSAEPSAVAETVAEPGAIPSELPTEDTQPASAEETTTPSPPATEEPAVDTEKVVECAEAEPEVVVTVEDTAAPVSPAPEEPATEIPKVVESADPEPELALKAPTPPHSEEPAAETPKEPEAESPAAAEAPPPSEEPAPESAKETEIVVVEPVVASEPLPVAPEDTTAPAPSSTEEPAPPASKGGAGFKADPALLDFGQSDPEDADLYSTRS